MSRFRGISTKLCLAWCSRTAAVQPSHRSPAKCSLPMLPRAAQGAHLSLVLRSVAPCLGSTAMCKSQAAQYVACAATPVLGNPELLSTKASGVFGAFPCKTRNLANCKSGHSSSQSIFQSPLQRGHDGRWDQSEVVEQRAQRLCSASPEPSQNSRGDAGHVQGARWTPAF